MTDLTHIEQIITRALLQPCDNHKDRADLARETARQVMEVRTAAFSPTHRHKKRGSLYRVIGNATAQVSRGHAFFNPETDDEWVEWPLRDGSRLTVYQAENGKLWARFTDEFEDGRFEELPATPSGQSSPTSYEDGIKEGLRRAAEMHSIAKDFHAATQHRLNLSSEAGTFSMPPAALFKARAAAIEEYRRTERNLLAALSSGAEGGVS